MSNEEVLQAIDNEVRACERCRLCETATQGVPGDGSATADILFLGEAPGYHEDKNGIPFVGRAGKLLDQHLGEIGLARGDVYITNVIKHRPPENRDPFPDEIKACRPFLDRQLEVIKPKMIVALGRFGLNYFFPEGKISQDHGVPRFWQQYLIYPVYHPAAALRNPAVAAALREDFLAIPSVLAKREELMYKPATSSEDEDTDQMSLF